MSILNAIFGNETVSRVEFEQSGGGYPATSAARIGETEGLVHAASPAAAAARSLAAMTNVTRPRMMAAAEPARFAIPMLCIVASFPSLLDVVASLCPFPKARHY